MLIRLTDEVQVIKLGRFCIKWSKYTQFLQEPHLCMGFGAHVIQLSWQPCVGLALKQILWPSDSKKHQCPICKSLHRWLCTYPKHYALQVCRQMVAMEGPVDINLILLSVRFEEQDPIWVWGANGIMIMIIVSNISCACNACWALFLTWAVLLPSAFQQSRQRCLWGPTAQSWITHSSRGSRAVGRAEMEACCVCVNFCPIFYRRSFIFFLSSD